MGPKVLLIGMDIADGALVDRWCEEGALPNLRALRESGVWGTPRTTADTMHVSAWPTLHTGTLPGKHGVYHAYRVRSGEQGIFRSNARNSAVPPFWARLDDAGRRSVVIDAFFTYPLEVFHGIQVNEYGTWTWFAEPGATPAGTWGEIRKRFGRYPFPEHTKVLTVPPPRWLRDRLRAAAAAKAKMVAAFLREKPWDFFYVTFAETHAAGHYLWHVVDPSYPSHDPKSAAGMGDALRDVYAAVDQAIGLLLRAAPEDAHVVVVSADGMGPNYAATNFLPDFLTRLGLRHVAGEDGAAGGTGGGGGKKGILGTARQLLPLSIRQEVTKRLPRSLHYKMSTGWASYGFDWTRTKAFVIPNANEGFVRLNLRGREPEGIVEPRGEAEEILAEIEEAVRGSVNPANGHPIVKSAVRAPELFPGPESGNLPDLVFTWNAGAKVGGEIESPAVGLLRAPSPHEAAPYYAGNHRPNAFLIARGPGFAPGSSLGDEHLAGLAPTILALLGCGIPPYMDGRPWPALLRGAR